jgi:hypothetical protein
LYNFVLNRRPHFPRAARIPRAVVGFARFADSGCSNARVYEEEEEEEEKEEEEEEGP